MSIKQLLGNNGSYFYQKMLSCANCAVNILGKTVKVASDVPGYAKSIYDTAQTVKKTYDEIQEKEGDSFSKKAATYVYDKHAPHALKQAIPNITQAIDAGKETYNTIQEQEGNNLATKAINHLASQYIPPAIQASIPSKPAQIAATLGVETLQKTTGIEGFKISHANGESSIYRFDNRDIARVEVVNPPPQENPVPQVNNDLSEKIDANLTAEKIAAAKKSVLDLAYSKFHPKLTTYLQSFVAFSFGLNKSLDDKGFYNNTLMHVVKNCDKEDGSVQFSVVEFIKTYNKQMILNHKATITTWQKIKIYALYFFTTTVIKALVTIIINNIINKYFDYLFAQKGENQEHILGKLSSEIGVFLEKYHRGCTKHPAKKDRNYFLKENISSSKFLGKYKTTEKGIEISKDLNYRILIEGISKFLIENFLPKSNQIAKESIAYIKDLKNTNKCLYIQLLPFILPLKIYSWIGKIFAPLFKFLIRKVLHVFIPTVVNSTKSLLQDKNIQNTYYKNIYNQILLNKSRLENIDINGNDSSVPFKAYANPKVKAGLKKISITLGKIITTLAPQTNFSEDESNNKLVKLLALLSHIPGIEKKKYQDLSLNKVYEEVLPLILDEIFNIYMHPEGMAELLNIIINSTAEAFSPNKSSKEQLKMQIAKLKKINGINARVLTILAEVEEIQPNDTKKLTLPDADRDKMNTAIKYLIELGLIPANSRDKEQILTIASEIVNIFLDMKEELLQTIKDLCINDLKNPLAVAIEEIVNSGEIGEVLSNFKVNPNSIESNPNNTNNLLDINTEIINLITPIALNQAETGLDIIFDPNFIQGLFNTLFKSSLEK